MQRLNEKWLKLINYYIIFTTSLYLLVYIVFAIQQKSISVTDKDIYGATLTGAVFAAVMLIYNFTFRLLIRKSNVWLAYLISVLLYAIFNTILVEVSLNTSSSLFFLINNYIIALFATAFGYLATFFGLAIIVIIYFITALGSSTPTMLGAVGDGLTVLFRVVACLTLLYIFRNKYEIEGVSNENYIERYFVKNEVVKLLTDSISDGIAIVDSDGEVKSINPGALKIFSKKSEAVLGKSYSEIVKLKTLNNLDVNKSNDPVYKSLKSIGSHNLEAMFVDQDEQKFIDINVSTIANQKTQDIYGAVIIVRDVSARKREEQARSEFISTASHEMRTPVAAIEGFLSLAMLPEVGHMDDKPRFYLEQAHENTKHLGRLFQDLLISSNAEDGRLVNHPKRVELISLIKDRLPEYQGLIKDRKELSINFVVGADKSVLGKNNKLEYYVFVDPDRIKEVFSNIISNAIKYSDSGNIEIGITGNESLVQIYVKDTGIGISGTDLSRIFDKFFRADSSSTRTRGGTGLGLFICKKIIELYSGKIWAESEKGVGSTFYINLPRVNAPLIKDNITKDNLEVSKSKDRVKELVDRR